VIIFLSYNALTAAHFTPFVRKAAGKSAGIHVLLEVLLRGSIYDNPLTTLYYLKMIQIRVNGITKHYDYSLAVSELLEHMSLSGKKIAVERNGEIVPRGVHGSTLLLDGDQLEIVAAVGGG
jgi:sulfur carrier protein